MYVDRQQTHVRRTKMDTRRDTGQRVTHTDKDHNHHMKTTINTVRDKGEDPGEEEWPLWPSAHR